MQKLVARDPEAKQTGPSQRFPRRSLLCNNRSALSILELFRLSFVRSNHDSQHYFLNESFLGDLSPLSDASLVTVLHLAREYQEALLPSVSGTGDTRRVLEAISMLEARI